MKTFGWYKEWLDKRMKDPEFRAGYEEYFAELINDEFVAVETKLKRLLFEAMPYIEDDVDYNSRAALMAKCGDYERARIGRRLLDEIKEALKGVESGRMVLKKEQYVCVYREGYDERDVDNYRVVKWSEPEVKRFRTADEMSEWISDREMDEYTDPNHRKDSGYRFEIIYSNLEK